MPVIGIGADSRVPDIEKHFKVSAGPGAGKTRWLVNHIKHVLHSSIRLGKTRKIACITYTNVAAETILERLGHESDKVEVSTIHSFLYKNVVKPYVHSIAAEYDLNISKIDGHDDKIAESYGFIREWKEATGQLRIRDDQNHLIIKAWNDLRWVLAEDRDELDLKTAYPHKIGKYAIKSISYIEYKKMRWRKGHIHHDDVLFFSFQIIKKFPLALKVLRAKFPYFFIDEFQDTIPIQTGIIKKLAEEETIVGVIGDKAQSIYSFQGAQPSQFTNFSLNGLVQYKIEDNYRSTNQIVSLLNYIRPDLIQVGRRGGQGAVPLIIIGEKDKALSKAKELCDSDSVCTLARDNITSNTMRKAANGEFIDKSLIEKLKLKDSDRNRRTFVITGIKAAELSKELKFKEAKKEALTLFRNYGLQEEVCQRKAFNLLRKLVQGYEEYKEKSLVDYVFYLNSIGCTLTPVTRGKVKDFYQSHTYSQLSLCVNITENSSNHRTIHKAKGAEFENVMLVLNSRDEQGVFNEQKELAFLFRADLEDEEQRIKYVAVSRARERLFINVPSLSGASRALIQSMGLQITNV